MGIESNNMAEALALLQGLNLAKEQGIRHIVVIGDFRLVIQALNLGNLPEDMKIQQILKKIYSFITFFQKFKSYHVLRSKNSLVDLAANHASSLDRGILDINGRKRRRSIP